MAELAHHSRERLIRAVLASTGFLLVALGVLGIFLPLLPTTPFLLLAAACWSRSSSRFYSWLMANRFLGKYLTNYREHHGLTVNQKVHTLTLIWAGIGFSALMAPSILWLRILLGTIGLAVTVHIIMLRSLTIAANKGEPTTVPPG